MAEEYFNIEEIIDQRPPYNQEPIYQLGKHFRLTPISDVPDTLEACNNAVEYKEQNPEKIVTLCIGPVMDLPITGKDSPGELVEKIDEIHRLDQGPGIDPGTYKA